MNSDSVRIIGDIFIVMGTSLLSAGMVRRLNMRTDRLFRGPLVCFLVVFAGAAGLAVWDVIELLSGRTGVGAYIRVVAGVITIASGIVVNRREHLDEYRGAASSQQVQAYLNQMDELYARMRSRDWKTNA